MRTDKIEWQINTDGLNKFDQNHVFLLGLIANDILVMKIMLVLVLVISNMPNAGPEHKSLRIQYNLFIYLQFIYLQYLIFVLSAYSAKR